MADDRYEPKRVLGIPISGDPHARQDEESRRVMGFPVDGYGTVDRDSFRALAHPVQTYRQWVRRRRLGPYLTDEDEPGREG